MKTLFTYVLTAMCSILLFTSCEKCATCTYTPSSAVVVVGDSARSVEVCNSGKVYDNAIERYESAGWVCK